MSPYPCNVNLLVNDASSIFNIPIWVDWLLIIILLFVAGLFSASENVFSNCNKYHFRVLADRGKTTAKAVSFLIDNFDDTLITVLFANNAIQYLMSILMSDVFINIAKTYGWAVQGLDSVLATVVMALLVYIITDSLFKIISKHIPNKMANFLVYIDIFCYFLMWPIVKFFKLLILLIHKLFKIKDKNILTKEDFIESADKAKIIDDNEDDNKAHEELLEPDEMTILNRTFTFDKISVNDVFTKKEDIFAIDINNIDTKSLNIIILNSNYSRIPVFEDNIDNIIGVLTIRIYFKEYLKDPHLDIRSVLNTPLFIKGDEKVDAIFNLFNKTKHHIAFVKDKDGNLIGMVTMDDILEELVGDIDEDKVDKLRENKYAS
jgi:CBS domain containing-hemolysin-like protein